VQNTRTSRACSMSSPHDKPQPHKNDKQDARTATHKVAEESSHIFDELNIYATTYVQCLFMIGQISYSCLLHGTEIVLCDSKMQLIS